MRLILNHWPEQNRLLSCGWASSSQKWLRISKLLPCPGYCKKCCSSIRVHASFWILVFSGYMPSGIAESYGGSIFSLLRNQGSQTQWSKSEREKQISYINVYMWNPENWYRWTYLQGRNRDADIENEYVDTEERRRVWNELGDWGWHTYIYIPYIYHDIYIYILVIYFIPCVK